MKETKEEAWFEHISKFFGKYIKEVGLFGISVSFNPPEQDLKDLVGNFPEVLNNLLEKIKNEKAGLFIALDDINGLVEKAEFKIREERDGSESYGTRKKGIPQLFEKNERIGSN